MNDASENTPKPASLHAKLAEVMAEVGRIPKRGRNEFHKYDYATEADIVEAVRGALSSRSVSLVPSVKQVLREGTLTTVLMTFTFTDGATGETTAHDWAGTGDDKGDKGLYKAMTGALKYFILKTFLLPTGDDPEADADTDRRASGRGRTARPTGPLPEAGAPKKCLRCGEDAQPGQGLCVTCARLAAERKRDDAARAAKADGPVEGGTPTEKPPGASPAPRKKSPADAARARAFALMDKYGIPNDAAHRPDRLAIYGKALDLKRLATEDEAKAFGANEWDDIGRWLVANHEPPMEDAPPASVAYDEAT